ncbi:MAG: alpha-hydroxy-acid oxidizing enzyme [Candidatus Binatia bacterium]|nr:MAG: alpha-hydroxy-acid oxidizing enzyme [Candidatus Binatia bacterium]
MNNAGKMGRIFAGVMTHLDFPWVLSSDVRPTREFFTNPGPSDLRIRNAAYLATDDPPWHRTKPVSPPETSRSSARALATAHNIAALRSLARRRLPRAIFDYVDGGAEDETAVARNRTAFARYSLLPRVLVDVGRVDLSTTVLGEPVAFPVLLAPCGLLRLVHPEGDVAAARAAHAAGTLHILSTMSATSMEELARKAAGRLWYQIYVWRDRKILEGFLERARAAGYGALCLSVDSPVVGQRERDLRHGMGDPPRVRLRTALDACLHPRWLAGFLRGGPVGLPNVLPGVRASLGELGRIAKREYDPTVTWRDLEWMVARWKGPFVVKGILRADDAVRAVECGARAIVVSNHGGRQLDHAAATLEVLPEIVDAVGKRAEVYLDGGIRRGTDVVKALALGARACLVGRAYVYGLAAGGEAGVRRALEILRSETERALALLGCPSVGALDRSFLREERGSS